MLCKQCHEQIEVGEAHAEEYVGGRLRFFHLGCKAKYHEEEKGRALNHYTQQLKLLRREEVVKS